ncbi:MULTISPECIES: DUF397 domain-containing protein [Nocardia]|uniref:DUF397 domain-containing protein n=1 Tax=Nocardia TaxID=1817 RepID=UPI0007E9A57B|nr:MULTISPECIES: DUF397 domain-containing protein [Nocardia]MBF6275338.1 DUF397 domain-containing protein [Nocardia nova]OBA53861.1 DUF397 domain-containing protein [Nocardia sp. 852002-51101_SCH5132738]OBB53446.1 DUF397 domain-containing protein [Nocardia sp. 852002-51244_SCH5132740]OBF78665.1 DUF397 domain-containing protein [Mycobacterium sp. 852002-51759_SCH5129042]
MTVDLSGAKWFKSSRSTATRECVEVAFLDGSMVGIRDSKNPNGPALVFTADEWDAFTDTMLNGGFSQPQA